MPARIILVALLALAALFGLRWFDPGPAQRPALATPAGSDYYLLEATTRQFTRQGSLRYSLRAAKVLHFADDSAELTAIRVHYPGADQGRWRLAAARGQIPADSRDILLSGDVVVHHDTRGAPPLRLETPRVWIRTERDRAETEAPVTVEGPGRSARAVGMTLLFDRELLTLHHDVQATYQPRR